MRHEEEEMQIGCVRWFSIQYPGLKDLLHHSPNGGRRTPREGARFKAMGTRAGFPDLILCVPRGESHGLFVEMKSMKGTQEASQKREQRLLESQGYEYHICRSLEEFIRIINEYLKK